MPNNNLILPEHIGDGLYMQDNGYEVLIALNHHENTVASLDIENLDRAIIYLEKVKQRLDKIKNKLT
jgi:hypothetical protein